MMRTVIPLVALLCAGFAAPAFADKPGQGKGNNQASQGTVVITDRDRNVVQSYYRNEFAAGHCPPGLAKKHNGCLPPGQARKLWTMGQPLPGALVFHLLPGTLLTQLSPVPSDYQYVRVANDILLMTIGTRLIVGALADLGGMSR